MDIFTTGFCVLTGLCVILMIYTRNAMLIKTSPEFTSLQRVYLGVYLLAMSGDWLQGPHVYALYQSYGLSTHNIQVLFVGGFGASMLVGTVVGSFADKYGRRVNCILYGILYSVACVTKHFSNFWVLMVGRVLGGTATSILYSAFESWLVYEHSQRGFEKDLLSHIFRIGVLGNSIVAIVSGLAAQWVADGYGFVAPFDLSVAMLMVMIVVIMLTWTENYGDSTTSLTQIMRSAIQAIRSDKKILYLGLVQSLFEGAMYMFVLEWTPALTPRHSDISGQPPSGEQRGTIPHGIIFSAFMVAVMFGSYIFKILFKFSTPDSFLRYVLGLSAVSLFLPAISQNQTVMFLCFLVFECCVGIFWPAIGTMRGQYVPEKTRATIMNFFRVPLNFIVIVMLLQSLSLQTIFLCCAAFLSLAAVCQGLLHRLSSRHLQIPLTVRRDHLPSPVSKSQKDYSSALETDSLKH